MNNVVCLRSYRAKSKKNYLRKYGARLDRFIVQFVERHSDVDSPNMTTLYAGQSGNPEMAWDYIDFRDVLIEALEVAWAGALMGELQRQHWFDGRFITHEGVMERCISTFIITRCERASTVVL